MENPYTKHKRNLSICKKCECFVENKFLSESATSFFPNCDFDFFIPIDERNATRVPPKCLFFLEQMMSNEKSERKHF